MFPRAPSVRRDCQTFGVADLNFLVPVVKLQKQMEGLRHVKTRSIEPGFRFRRVGPYSADIVKCYQDLQRRFMIWTS